ncbi:hypothetical protein SMIE22_14720 [Streptococcus mitis]|uniref:hypothetical protein n=1 Tax=Streptococcus mitis TaxID=28037 RepID=UPI00398BC7AA
MRQTNVRGSLSLRGFRKLRTGAIVATGVILLGLGFLAPTVSASEQDGVWVARTVEEVKADLQKEGDLFKYVIKWGDTLSVISEASNIPVDVLQEMNQASGKNLFLPHNELYFTEAETVSDTVTKHKIVIKESGASGEVRTYEVLLKKDQETKDVTFELTDVTEKVEKMTVNYSPVYQPVSAPVVERAEESGEGLTPVAPASKVEEPAAPALKTEEPTASAPKAEDAATTPAPKETAPEVVRPAPKEEKPATPATKVEEPTESAEPASDVTTSGEQGQPAEETPALSKPETPASTEEVATEPKGTESEAAKPSEPNAETPTPKVEEPTTPTPKEDATEGKIEAPKVEQPEASAEPTEPAPVVEEGTSGEQDQPAEETPAPSKPETPSSTEEVAKEAEGIEPESAKPTEPKEAESTTEGTSTGTAESAPASTESAANGAEGTEGVTPKVEETAPAGEEGNVETSNNPSTGATTSTDSGGSTTVTDATPSNDETTEQSGSSAPKAEVSETPVVEGTTSENKEEQPAPKEVGTTAGDEGKEAEESGTEANTTPKEDTPEGTVDSAAGEEGKDSKAEGPETSELTEPEPAPSVSETANEDNTVAEGTTSSEAGNTDKTSVGETGKQDSATNAPSADSKEEAVTTPEATEKEVKAEESAEAGTSATTETATPAPAVDSTNEAPNEGESENPVAEGTPVTEEQPSTDNTASSSATSNSADSSSSTESTAPESTTATTGNTSNSSTDVTTDGNSNDSTSNEEKPQDDEPAVEHQGSEKSLEEDTKDSNKAAIDDDRKTKDAEINKSTLNEDKKKEALEKVKQLTEEYHNKLKSEQDTDKQADLIDEYRDKLREIETPGVEHDGPDFKKPIESHAGGTTIDENSTVANSALTSSNPSSQPSSSEDSPQAQPAATSDSSTTGDSGFRSAGTYQPRVTRRRRSIEEPQNTVSIYYNFDGMKDIPGFFGDPGEKNTVTIPAGTSEAQAKELVKEKIQAKVQELNKHGYKVKEEIVFEQDTTVKNFNYVVTFTKETTGTTGFRIAPKVQVRAKKVVKRDLSNKTKHINVYYNLTSLKDIAGALGELGGENVLTFSGETSKEELKRAVEEKTKAQIEKLKKQGFTVTSKTDLDQIIEGGDSYDYVVEFTKESKSASANNTGFRKAPLVQRRAKRSTEAKETVNVNIYFNLKTLPGIAGALDVDGETTIKLPKNASEEEVKEVIKAKIAKVESRGYRVNDFYFGAKTEKGYDYVVEFTK